MHDATIHRCVKALGLRLYNLLQQFVWVALLRARPQDLPAGRPAMWVAMLMNVLSYVLAVVSLRSVADSLVLAITDLALSGVCLYAAVAVVNKGPRFQQAFTSLAGGTAVLNFAAVPVLWLSAGSASPTVGLLDVVIIVWGLAIIAHVLRHTLEVSAWLSVALAFGFYVVVLNLLALTGVIENPKDESEIDSQMSIYQSVTSDWLSEA